MSQIIRRRRFMQGMGAISALVYVFLYIPVVVLIVFSFNESRVGGQWSGFSTEWYGALRENDALKDALGNSLTVALTSTAIAVVLGTMLSLGLDRRSFRGRPAAQQVLNLPVVTPEIVTGVSLLAFFSLALSQLNDVLGRSPADAIRLGLPTIIAAHVAFDTAFVALVVRASLRNLDPTVEEASLDLGADPWTTFWRVTLPSIMPGVLGGALLAFALSFDNFVITFYVSGPGSTTLPIEVWGQVRRTISPEINALSSLIFGASSLSLLSALVVQAVVAARRNRRALAGVDDDSGAAGVAGRELHGAG